jgi:plasmid stabilization system protein ParE
VSKPVRTNPFADDDIFSHIQYYAARSPFLGERLWNEVQTAFKLISEYPLIGERTPSARARHRQTSSPAALPILCDLPQSRRLRGNDGSRSHKPQTILLAWQVQLIR